METLGIVGAGNVGSALARLLEPRFEVLIASRSRAGEAAEFAGGRARAVSLGSLAAASDCILVAVPDRAVRAVAAQLAAHRPGVVLHTSGSQGPSGLAPLPGQGASCAMFHPLQTVPDPDSGVAALPGSCFGLCGAGAAATWCGRLAALLDGTVVEVAEARLPLYHAAAVMASNCAVGLLHAASELMHRAGLERTAASHALRPLVEATLANALTMRQAQALTGPVMRGDAITVRHHLEAMRGLPAGLTDLYRECGLYLLSLAMRSGLPEREAREVQAVLRGSG